MINYILSDSLCVFQKYLATHNAGFLEVFMFIQFRKLLNLVNENLNVFGMPKDYLKKYTGVSEKNVLEEFINKFFFRNLRGVQKFHNWIFWNYRHGIKKQPSLVSPIPHPYPSITFTWWTCHVPSLTCPVPIFYLSLPIYWVSPKKISFRNVVQFSLWGVWAVNIWVFGMDVQRLKIFQKKCILITFFNTHL